MSTFKWKGEGRGSLHIHTGNYFLDIFIWTLQKHLGPKQSKDKLMSFSVVLISDKEFARKGFPGGSVVKNPAANAGDMRSAPSVGDPTCLGATEPVYHSH